MKFNIDDLTGRALMWAAILAMGRTPQLVGKTVVYRTDHGSWDRPWLTEADAGALMREHWIGLERPTRGQTPPQWRALADSAPQRGSTARVVEAWSTDMAHAVYRCFVKSRLGDQIELPGELAEEAAGLGPTP